MNRNKNDYETNDRNIYRNNYKSVKSYYGNTQVRPNMIENFSLYGSLVGGSRNSNIEYSDQCYCNQDFRGQILNNGNGRCYPEKLCGDCNLNKSGLCTQSAEPSGVTGV